ncbi:MAG: hypothetical protein ACK5Y6_04665 [Pseudomonadota bacterium]
MVQLAKCTNDFDIFGAEPWHRQGGHRKFKSGGDFSRMRQFGIRNCRF